MLETTKKKKKKKKLLQVQRQKRNSNGMVGGGADMIKLKNKLYSTENYYKIMARFPCAVQYMLVAYLFYT